MGRPTEEEIMAAIEADECIGFCTKCGNEQSGVEPDARNYICEDCGAAAVFGAEQWLIEGL